MEKKVKVLQVLHGLAPGGIESFVINLYENIDKEKFDVRFALATDYHQFHENMMLNQGAIIYKTCDLNGINKKLKHFFRLVKLLRSEKFDVVHTHIDFFNGINLLAAFIARVPIRVSHSHSTNSVGGFCENASLIVKMYRNAMRILINLCSTHQLGCSTDANKYMYGNLKKAKVVYNGINMDIFSVNRRKESIKDTDFTLITVGRMSEAKNSKFIVQVVYELQKFLPNIKLNWVGEGPQYKEIRELVKRKKLQNNISFLGVRTDVAELFLESDYMIFPSKWEGLGFVLIEAQSCGVPCFISDKIPNEADLGLCTILSLELDAYNWAKKIYKSIIEKTYNNQLNQEKKKQYDIKNVVSDISNIYKQRA